MAVGLAIGTVGVILLAMLREQQADQGQALFIGVGLLAFVYCLLSGILTTSDCVSEEKRDGTLGLLFLTNLRGYDVVVGKLVAHSMRTISALVALLPVIWVPVLLGGVSYQAVACLAGVLGNTMLLSLAIGVLVSVVAQDARHAIGGTVFVLAVLLFLLPGVRWVLTEYVLRASPLAMAPPPSTGDLPEPLGWILLVNPILPVVGTMEVLLRGIAPPAYFWQSLVVQDLLAWVALAGACLLLPKVWQDRARVSRQARQKGGAVPDARRMARSEVLDRNPFAWLYVRDRRGQALTWAGLGIVGCGWLWGFAEVKDEWLQGFIGLSTLFALGVWLKIRVASMACRHLHDQRRTGALELLLCTPQTPSEIVRGNFEGLRRILGAPLLAVSAAATLLLAGALSEARGADALDILGTFLVGFVILFLDLWTLTWAGMWFGFRHARFIRAYGLTLGWVMTFPWACYLLSLVFVGIAAETFHVNPGFDASYSVLLGWWALIAAGIDAWMFQISRKGLLRHLRVLAAESDGAALRARSVPAVFSSSRTPLSHVSSSST